MDVAADFVELVGDLPARLIRACKRTPFGVNLKGRPSHIDCDLSHRQNK